MTSLFSVASKEVLFAYAKKTATFLTSLFSHALSVQCLPNKCKYFSTYVKFFLASLSVITPWFVEMIVVPSPPNTLGSSSLFAYTRRPGFEILLRPEITFSFLSAPYFNVMWIVLKHPSSTMSYFAIYPSLKRISAIAILHFRCRYIYCIMFSSICVTNSCKHILRLDHS